MSQVCIFAVPVLLCAWPCAVVNDRCVPAALSQPLRYGRILHHSPHNVLKTGSILLWHGIHLVLLGDGALQAAVVPGKWSLLC